MGLFFFLVFLFFLRASLRAFRSALPKCSILFLENHPILLLYIIERIKKNFSIYNIMNDTEKILILITILFITIKNTSYKKFLQSILLNKDTFSFSKT